MGVAIVQAVKILIFKNPRWRMAKVLEKPVLHHYGISRFFAFSLVNAKICWVVVLYVA